jgi:FMN phosphatase YigB (HAD superfamily)
MSVFTVLICALVLAGWIAIWLRHRHSERRRRAREEEWDELARRYPDLDTELDRVWYGR